MVFFSKVGFCAEASMYLRFCLANVTACCGIIPNFWIKCESVDVFVKDGRSVIEVVKFNCGQFSIVLSNLFVLGLPV